MVYCDACGKKRGWPFNSYTKSGGPCQICYKIAICNDVPTKNTPNENVEAIFILHPGITGYFGPYWELYGEPSLPDSFYTRAKKGAIEEIKDGILKSSFPRAWAKGRFYALIPLNDGEKQEWRDVTKYVIVDEYKGLQQCPEHIREKYHYKAKEMNSPQ
jgi:hypothetical protein